MLCAKNWIGGLLTIPREQLSLVFSPSLLYKGYTTPIFFTNVILATDSHFDTVRKSEDHSCRYLVRLCDHAAPTGSVDRGSRFDTVRKSIVSLPCGFSMSK